MNLLNRLALLSLLLATLLLPAGRAQASPDVDLSVPYAFSTVAAGLVPADSSDVNVAIARIDVGEGETAANPVAEPGFIIVISGRFLLERGDADPDVLLDAGDAHWIPAADDYVARPMGGEGSFWRVAVGAQVGGRDLDGRDPYTFTFSSSTTGDGLFLPLVVRTGSLAAATTASLGAEGDRVAYAFVLEGEASFDGSPLAAGEYVSPFFDSPEAAVMDAAALVGYVALGEPIETAAP